MRSHGCIPQSAVTSQRSCSGQGGWAGFRAGKPPHQCVLQAFPQICPSVPQALYTVPLPPPAHRLAGGCNKSWPVTVKLEAAPRVFSLQVRPDRGAGRWQVATAGGAGGTGPLAQLTSATLRLNPPAPCCTSGLQMTWENNHALPVEVAGTLAAVDEAVSLAEVGGMCM